MLQPLARSLHDLRNAADAPSLADAVERSLCDRGFNGFLFYDVARPLGEGAVIRNFDDGLVARYDHLKLWKMDPLGVQGSERRQPIVWDARYPAEYREQELLWDPLIAAGFRNFIAIPIYGPTGRRNIFVGFAEKFRRSARVTERVIDEFVVHRRAHRQLSPEQRDGQIRSALKASSGAESAASWFVRRRLTTSS